jgi:hypothetical protein
MNIVRQAHYIMLNGAKLFNSPLFKKHQLGCQEKNQGSGAFLPLFVAAKGNPRWQAARSRKERVRWYRGSKSQVCDKQTDLM